MYNASLAETQKAAAASDEGQNIQNIEQAKDIISKHVKDRQSKKVKVGLCWFITCMMSLIVAIVCHSML